MHNQKTVCHVTSVHTSDDTRIFHKECKSLENNGYKVYLVAPGQSQNRFGIEIIGCGFKPIKRISRIFFYSRKICKTAINLNCDVYHLHDPELLLYLNLFRNKKVIFDSHEDYTYEKSYLPKLLRKPCNLLYKNYEKYCCKKLNGVICCYHWTLERMKKNCKNNAMIFNYPVVNKVRIKTEKQVGVFAYAGGISEIWNLENFIKAIPEDNNTKVKLILAGRENENYIDRLKNQLQWRYVKYLGKLPFNEVVQKVYSKAFCGIALLDYIPECKGNIGNLANTKLFEIMEVGLPVICTDFVLWRKIIDEYKCGICVNPHNIDEIKKAIDYLINHPEEANKMGENGRKAILEKYNWSKEETKLLDFYKKVVGEE